MADVTPNIELGLKQMEVQRDELRLILQKQELRLLEIEDEKERIAVNMAATAKEIKNLEDQIGKLAIQVDKEKENN